MGAQWKREFVQDHKFDFINVEDFIDNSCWRQFTYSLVFAAIIRGILVYCSDIFTAANLLANSNENSFVPPQGVQLEVFGKLPFEVYKWLFSGCILLGFALLGWEIRRARAIIASRDISYAFTSLIASRYYTVRSYPHYCFFAQINNSKKTVDEVAFFCFFTFRNWKRLILADAPRQIINATILYQTFHKHLDSSFFDWDRIVGSGNNFIYKKISLGAMMFTVFMFALSLIMLISAVIMYIPLVSHIQGNLKEFCCHKIDKRIDELIRKKSKTRAADEAEKAGRNPTMANMQQPTLPNVDDLLEPSLPTVGTPRTAYAQKSPLPYGMQTPKTGYNYIQQPLPPPAAPYMHSNHSNISNSNKHGGPPPLSQNQYGYDYYQVAKSPPPSVGMTSTPGKPKELFDPYAESAFTSDDVYGGVYNQDQGQPYVAPQSRSQGHEGYSNAGGVGSPVTYYSGSSSSKAGSPPYRGQTPPPRGRRYDDYFPERSASPIQSQHGGSDLDSHYGGSVVGGSVVGGHTGGGGGGYGPVSRVQGGGYGPGPSPGPGGYSNVRYAGQGAAGGGASYGNEYQPINPRRQDTTPNPNRSVYRGGGGGPGY
ncbi:hypothetical protein BG015_000163 [Linnemannia schmuckeri]|uniref:Uncharacterized protein n=1 Tax=Linnemannia schmuckeri TaxID=64567 RepID=A0A9P5S4J8_9FUNG|nr:hypothetical protein BG015_000163 [Linnemannia schmuckeri]